MVENGSDLSPDGFLFGEGRHHSTWERLLHLTENEYSVIRNAAVDAICELSLASQVDVARAVDCLIDVLNDEMESVRVNALRSLHNIALIEKPSLAEIHIRSLEVVLQDGEVDVRQAAHRLLRVVQYSSSEALAHTVNGLLDNMRRFPEDAASVYRCLWEMAALHPQMATQLTPGLLGIDPRFLPVEKPMESTEDYGKIIFVLSGNKACKPDTRPVLPAYVERYGLLVYAKLSDNPYFADCEELESLNFYRCQQADQKQWHP
ncbi:hypothetical protein HDU85_003208 [Gaertneriomyces sp. JEL0708]|nr:hypothetical protein HDU85_003208 [Gaertneriomyces sp. JEL0708]